MNHLKLHTEYSFRNFYGKTSDVLDALVNPIYAGICDRNGTWGHVDWKNKCLSRNIKPIFGVELACVADMEDRRKQASNYMSFIAMNQSGLTEIYELVALAQEKFYYFPRIDVNVIENISDNVTILSGDNLVVIENSNVFKKSNFYLELSPLLLDQYINRYKHIQSVIICNNFYPKSKDHYAYEISIGLERQHLFTDMSIHTPVLNISELHLKQALLNNDLIAEKSNVTLPKAKMVKPFFEKSFREICLDSAKDRNITFNDSVYKERFERELDLIKQKKFEDYFLVVYDLVKHAKKDMLVGPARGSSCGSLICYMLGITEIDPIKFDLLFERFIDLNRDDYPDIDIDFPDSKRDDVLKYLKRTYGYLCVAKLGTISRFKPKSALIDVAKELKINLYELDAIKSQNIDDLKSAFKDSEAGRKLILKYPELAIAAEIEGHARHSGLHAAGIVVTNSPLTNFCSIDSRTGAIQMEKKEAEDIGMLKIDVLGLRTLSVIEDTLEQMNVTKDFLFKLSLDDENVFSVLNNKKFAGVFQFEGNALQCLCSQMTIDKFDDLVALTSLARPGPLQCGGTYEYLKCRTGKKTVEYEHELMRSITEKTYGVIVFQEQVMQIGRLIGKMTWADVSSLRKAMSKSLGQEHFNIFYDKFKSGAVENGLDENQIKIIWSKMQTMGAYAFNKSHAVSYSVVTYWCLYLKYYQPLEFACACLKNSKDNDQVISIIRELKKEKIEYLFYDKNLSQQNWSVQDNKIVGGLLIIKGIGLKSSEEILRKRENNIALTERQDNLLKFGETPFDNIFEISDKWQHIIDDPKKYNILSPLITLDSITSETESKFVFIAKLHDIVIKDINSKEGLERRNGKVLSGENKYIVLKATDDTATITCMIGRFDFNKIGNQIINNHNDDNHYLIKGSTQVGFKTVTIKRFKKLNDNPDYA